MSEPVTVNPVVTDAVTQTNVKVLGEGPAEGVDIAIQASAHATGLAMENATQTQGGMQQINNAAVAALLTMITDVTPAAKPPKQ